MQRVFITGCSGYIGGDFLSVLSKAKLNASVAVLERSADDAKTIAAAYPEVRIVHGTLDDSALLREEGSVADVVINLASAQHAPSVQALHQGLSQANGQSQKYLIQISGATLLSSSEVANKCFGEPSDFVVDDFAEIERVRNTIRASPKRAIDNYVLDVAEQPSSQIRTALLAGPMIYGPGRGPVNQRSGQLPELSRIALQRGNAVHIGKGLNRWSSVHVHDFSDLILLLTRRALSGDTDPAVWGKNGIYLAGTNETPTFGEIARIIQQITRNDGLTTRTNVESITAEEANKLSPNAQMTLGTNARGISRRAQEVLGWRPGSSTVVNDLPRTVRTEAQRLGASKL